jgi:hypothetical protein
MTTPLPSEQGSLPFLAALVVASAILMIWPQLCLILPNLLRQK